jgi:hypothetical protein
MEATSLVEPRWLLFMPSLYGFAIYDSYSNAAEYNKLFDLEQSRYISHHILPSSDLGV